MNIDYRAEIALARSRGAVIEFTADDMERFANKVRLQERTECALLCGAHAETYRRSHQEDEVDEAGRNAYVGAEAAAIGCSKAILSRGAKP